MRYLICLSMLVSTGFGQEGTLTLYPDYELEFDNLLRIDGDVLYLETDGLEQAHALDNVLGIVYQSKTALPSGITIKQRYPFKTRTCLRTWLLGTSISFLFGWIVDSDPGAGIFAGAGIFVLGAGLSSILAVGVASSIYQWYEASFITIDFQDRTVSQKRNLLQNVIDMN